MTHVILLAATAALLQAGASVKASSPYDDAFRANYRTHSIGKCVAVIASSYPEDDNATQFCTCVADKLLATRTVAELSRDLTQEEVQPITAECFKAHSPPASPAQ
jgi:hypothetical protein